MNGMIRVSSNISMRSGEMEFRIGISPPARSRS